MYAKFINSKNKKVEFDIIPPYILTRLTADTTVNLYSSKGLGQDGSTYVSNTLTDKDIIIEGAIVSTSEVSKDLLKEKIISTFNPKIKRGYLYFKNRRIKCILNKLPIFNDEDDTFQILLTAHEPYWTDINETTHQVAKWIGAFHFPLIIPKDEGIIMGYREPSLIVHINNGGQVATGMIIEFIAKGHLSNPSLFNLNTRESIKILKDMDAGDKIIINTNFGNKEVKFVSQGIESDALNYLDIIDGGDTFLQLDTGDNAFRYDADHNIDNLEVTIKYYNRYLGV